MTRLRLFPIRSSTLALLGALACFPGCGGGGGGGAGGSSSGTLLTVDFPDPLGVNGATLGVPPPTAPLVQQVVFTFDAPPPRSEVSADTLPIRDMSGVSVSGTYQVSGKTVTFTPSLPLRPVTPTDNGGAGLLPGTQYQVRVGTSTWRFIGEVNLALRNRFPDPADASGVWIRFTTTSNPANYFLGLDKRRPRLLSADPADGTVGVSPALYSDPANRFSPRQPFFLEFDAPVDPSTKNLEAFRLVDLDTCTSNSPAGISLGIDVLLRVNEIDRAVVEVMPSGILPFGHLLSLEYPTRLLGLTQTGNPLSQGTTVASTFTVQSASATPIVDRLTENFDARDQMETNVSEVSLNLTPAQWDVLDSNVLEPGSFEGTGELGPFTPPVDPGDIRTVVLDTNRQALPLFDGSTPLAKPGTEVVGGVFHFTDIVIPDTVIVEPRGSNPLVLTATGTVSIAGQINLAGRNGNDENSFDSSNTSNPGGPGGPGGGGRGGEGQPILWQGAPGISPLVSPPRGGQGWGPGNATRTGGEGGECGMLDLPDANGQFGTDYELDLPDDANRWGINGGNPVEPCQELTTTHNNGNKPPGGGGGSHVKQGVKNTEGIGNVRADGLGNFLVTTPAQAPDTWKVLLSGNAGAWSFSDGDPNNDFFGRLGEQQEPFAGQGGGAGGSALDSYYCGKWCMFDATPLNDNLCVWEGSFSTNPIVEDPEGDARGGSGGGGGGSLVIKAIGTITLSATAVLDAHGGDGGAGEAVACGNWAGSGGGGSGGALVLQSATDIIVQNGAVLNVAGGSGAGASDRTGGNTQQDYNSIAFDPRSLTLYSTIRRGSRTQLHSLSLVHGLGINLTDVGHADSSGDALAYRTVDGLLYHVSGFSNVIFEKINPVTFASTTIPINSLPIALSPTESIAYDEVQDVFYWALTDRKFFRVTPAGLDTFIGTTDHVASGMAIKDGRLYSISTTDKLVREIDPATAATISTSSGTLNFQGFSIPNSNGGQALALRPDTNELWGLVAFGNQQLPAGYELVKINEATGDASSFGTTYAYVNAPDNCKLKGGKKVGAGGNGGDGIIQLQLPGGRTATVQNPSDLTSGAWADPMNLLNPSEFADQSFAQSEWYDMGRTICRPPKNTNPQFTFRGLKPDGTVRTDAAGNVLNPGAADIRVDFLGVLEDPTVPGRYLPGLEPRSNFIPPNATVRVEFQGGDAIAEGSKEVDPLTVTTWAPDPSVASGMQFIRYRISFDLSADSSMLTQHTPRPTVQSVSIKATF